MFQNGSMMADWQPIVVALAVACSALVLLRRAWKALRGTQGACSGCGSCASRSAGRPTLMAIEPPPPGPPPATKR